jgi:hypothetical protein
MKSVGFRIISYHFVCDVKIRDRSSRKKINIAQKSLPLKNVELQHFILNILNPSLSNAKKLQHFNPFFYDCQQHYY